HARCSRAPPGLGPDEPRTVHVTETHDEGAPDADADFTSRLWERMVPMYSLLEGRLDRVLTHRHDIGLGALMALGLLVKSSPAPLSVSGIAGRQGVSVSSASRVLARLEEQGRAVRVAWPCDRRARSEEHTSELQSRENIVCRL